MCNSRPAAKTKAETERLLPPRQDIEMQQAVSNEQHPPAERAGYFNCCGAFLARHPFAPVFGAAAIFLVGGAAAGYLVSSL